LCNCVINIGFLFFLTEVVSKLLLHTGCCVLIEVKWYNKIRVQTGPVFFLFRDSPQLDWTVLGTFLDQLQSMHMSA